MGLEVNAFVLIRSDSAAPSEPTLNPNFPIISFVYVAHFCELQAVRDL